MSRDNKNSNIIGDLFGFVGETIGQTVSLGADVVVGTVKGVAYDLPVAIVDGYQSGFEFMSDEAKEEAQPVQKQVVPDKVEPEVISKADYRAKVAAELAKIDEAIAKDDVVEVSITGDKNDNT